jgi:sulfocyanin SoxE-like protein
MAAPSSAVDSSRSGAFIVISVVAAVGLSAVVGYLGLAGFLGGQIPGTYHGTGGTSTPHCEGSNVKGNYSFQFVAGLRGTLTFNGSVPGPCVRVGVMSQVTVTLAVATDAGSNHSWVLVASSALPNALPAFSGVGFSNATRFSGVAPGQTVVFHFQATSAGAYRYLCEVPGHADAGMWGSFNVSLAAPVVLSPVGGHAHSPIGSTSIARFVR